MKKYGFDFRGYVEYIANSEEEAEKMFENDHFSGWAMDIDGIIEEEIEEDD